MSGIPVALWLPERARLLDALANPPGDIATVIANLDAAPWERAAWRPTCAYGSARGPDGYAYLVGGWNGQSSSQAHYGEVHRTRDFMVCERAPGVSYLGRSYCGAAFSGPKLMVGPGFNNLIVPSQCTRLIYGAVPGDQMALHDQSSCYDHEHAMFHAHDDGNVHIAGGLRYTGSSPAYFFPNESFRFAPAWTGGSLELRTSTLGLARRGFGTVSWNGAIWMLGGRNDNSGTNYATAIKSTDGMQTIQVVHQTLPFGARYGFGICKFKGRVTVGFGTSGASPIDDLWSSDDPNLAPESWVQHTAPGIGARSLCDLIPLVIDGVETLGVIGGYGGTNNPRKDVHVTTNHDGPWTALTGSDFWVP